MPETYARIKGLALSDGQLKENQSGRVVMEKFYIVPKDSKLGKEYLEYLDTKNKITDLFRKFSMQKNIHTHTFYPTVTRLWIDPDVEDIKNFASGFMADTPGKFKLRNSLNKEWVSLCKENGLIKDAHKPYVPFYFTFGCFKCRWRLFDVDNVIYCTFSSEGDFKAPEGVTEIKASEFYSIMKSKNLIIN